MSEWYIVYNGQQVGPMTKEQLLSYGLNPQSKVWREGMTEWADVFAVPELMEFLSLRTAAGSPAQPVQGGIVVTQTPPTVRQEVVVTTTRRTVVQDRVPSGKSKTVAGILAILLGSFGVQYFYLGKIGAGILSFLIIWVFPVIFCIVTCGGGLFIYFIPTILWLLYIAQGIEMLCLSDEDFDDRFGNSTSFWPFF